MKSKVIIEIRKHSHGPYLSLELSTGENICRGGFHFANLAEAKMTANLMVNAIKQNHVEIIDTTEKTK